MPRISSKGNPALQLLESEDIVLRTAAGPPPTKSVASECTTRHALTTNDGQEGSRKCQHFGRQYYSGFSWRSRGYPYIVHILLHASVEHVPRTATALQAISTEDCAKSQGIPANEFAGFATLPNQLQNCTSEGCGTCKVNTTHSSEAAHVKCQVPNPRCYMEEDTYWCLIAKTNSWTRCLHQFYAGG